MDNDCNMYVHKEQKSKKIVLQFLLIFLTVILLILF